MYELIINSKFAYGKQQAFSKLTCHTDFTFCTKSCSRLQKIFNYVYMHTFQELYIMKLSSIKVKAMRASVPSFSFFTES